jgi:hypothetical protein
MGRKPVACKIYFDLFSFIFNGGGWKATVFRTRIEGKKQDKSKEN